MSLINPEILEKFKKQPTPLSIKGLWLKTIIPTFTETPTPTQTPTLTPTETSTETPTPTETSTPTPTETSTETLTETPTPTITETPTYTPLVITVSNFTITTQPSGTILVDWGDTNTSNIFSGVTATHEYNCFPTYTTRTSGLWVFEQFC